MRNARKSATPSVSLIYVSCRPAVLKYVTRKLALAEGSGFRLSKRGPIGRMLYHLLRTPKQDRQYDCSVEQYPAKLPVLISNQLTWLDGCRHLTSQGIHDFNRQVEDLIEEEFVTAVRTLKDHQVPVETKQYAKSFMARYGFTEDDFSLDMLIKAEYRRRKATEKAKKPAGSIPICPLLVGPNAVLRV